MSKNSIKPFELLSEYERLSLKHKVISPQSEFSGQWSGVGFEVNGVRYVLTIDKIVEVLILTETTTIPGIASWVLGLGNIRGNLLPIVDLKSYLYGIPTKTTAHTRMVIIQQVGGQVGLVVDEVFGQKHFGENQLHTLAEENEGNPLKYVEITYMEEDITWNVLEVRLLVNDPLFQNAAAI